MIFYKKMKQICIVILSFLMIFSGVYAQEDSKKAVITFEKQKHDFGEIKEGKKYTVEFKIRNTGDAPLIFTKIDVSCNCITIDYPREPIKPGENAVIKVTLDANKKVGRIVKSIYVNSNAKNRLEVIRIFAFIK